MNRLFYPSEDFPHPTPFFLSVPDDWLAVHIPGTIMAAREPGLASFASNITVSWDRVPIDAKAATIATDMLDAGASGGELLGADDGMEDGGSIALIRHVDHRDSVDLVQYALIAIGPPTSYRTRDGFRIIGSREASEEAHSDTIRAILESFALLRLDEDSSSSQARDR